LLIFVLETNKSFDLWARRPELLDNRREIALEQQHARLGVIEDSDQFGRSEPHIQRHHNCARLDHAEVAFQKGMAVEAEICYPVAGLYSRPHQCGRETLATLP